ncbi:helix-turn-helix domain-containing protein [Coleofasciculus sp. F4-SAH-05]|uniref:helix-turn-helix domain-containing protein n=1 Tax=Coleofasciculus sp. F4-SAH-05 TaxID=3069525 RepID=UPI0032F72742
MFNRIYEFKLKPTNAQVVTFEEWLEQCRRVYNYSLAERKDWVNSRKCQINACSIIFSPNAVSSEGCISRKYPPQAQVRPVPSA